MRIHPNNADRPALASHLTIDPWPDSRQHGTGHDPLDRDTPPGQPPYCETFWLPIIGPTALLLIRQLTRHHENNPGQPIPTVHIAQSLGLGQRIDRSSRLADIIARVEMFKFARLSALGDHLALRPELPHMPDYTIQRLPDAHRALHDHLYQPQANTAPAAPNTSLATAAEAISGPPPTRLINH